MKNKQKERRVERIRKKLRSVSDRPRLTVFRSNTHIYAQIIDDAKAKTLVTAASTQEDKKLKKMEAAILVGGKIAKLALGKKIKEVVFDKGGYKFHGRIKALADAARKEGLQF